MLQAVNQYKDEAQSLGKKEIQLGIRNGVRKINVDTDSRLAITGAIRKVFAEKPEEFDPRSYLKPARDAMKKVVAERMNRSVGATRMLWLRAIEKLRAVYGEGQSEA